MSRNPKIAKWKSQIRRRKRAHRERRLELEASIETGIERVVEATERLNDSKVSEEVSAQLNRLARIASHEESDLSTLAYVDRELCVMAGDMSDDMTYEEAIDEADDVYGDQSDNDTYYGLDRSASGELCERCASMTYEEAIDEADDVYGDQSDNDTYYGFGRSAASPYEQAIQESDDVYGDQSDNETFYTTSFEDDDEWIDEEDRLDF